MTNEEIRDFAGELPAFHLGDSTPVIRANSLPVLLDLARTDEREKIKNQMLDGVMTDSEFEEYTGSKRDQPQGVDIWVSWGTRGYLPTIYNTNEVKNEKIN